jgi:phage recombination protein Bet
MNDNAPTIRQEMALNYADPKVLDTIKATVAQNATPPELAMFIQFCQSTGLNPFKKEIWFIKAGGRVQMMTGINGFFSIANSTPEFDGYESGLIDPQGAFVSAAYPKNDFIGAWCKVYRKDRRIPSEGVAMLAEYDKKQSTWNTMKRVMITKCAESVALRKAFPQQLNGLYTQEEMPADYAPQPLQLADEPKVGTVVATTANGSAVVESVSKPTYYSIWQLDDRKQRSAQEYLEKNGGAFDDVLGVWVAPRKLERLESCIVERPDPKPEDENQAEVRQ